MFVNPLFSKLEGLLETFKGIGVTVNLLGAHFITFYSEPRPSPLLVWPEIPSCQLTVALRLLTARSR